MKIHKRLHEEGTVAILITLGVIAMTVFLVNWFWPSQTVWHYLMYAFELVVLVLTVRFFRVPIWRKTTIEENAVLSPADGIVAANEEVLEDEYFHEKRRDTKGREILVRQIAGFVARRIVCELQPGDEAVVGEELGMIRFGSRVDVFLPLDAEVKVKIGDKTTGKETVLAILK